MPGLSKQPLEVVGEFAVARDPGGELNLIDPELSVKAVLKEGVLQEQEGLSERRPPQPPMRVYCHT